MTEFKLPEVGENVEQGDLVRLMISPGAEITVGQPVMELETDKAVIEVPSSVSGTVKEVHVQEGQTVKVGQLIFTVENGATRKEAPAQKKAPAATPQPVPSATTSAPQKMDVPAVEPKPASSPAKAAGPSEFRLPELGEKITQGDLVRLMISRGAKVSEGQPVMELETDKAVIEVPSSV